MPRPIVLAHGIARFDAAFAALGHDVYFKKIPAYLLQHGFDAHRGSVDFAGSVSKRANELAAEVERVLEQTSADKVHIIAHSMGGLDARHMIVDLGMADRVASLTTIGTPHRGTSVADRRLEKAAGLIDIAREVGIDLEGFKDLTRAKCREFNERAEDAEARNSVVYQTYSSFQAKARIVAPLQLSWQIIRDEENEDSDGLVPVMSQEWTARLEASDGTAKAVAQRRFPFGADHLNQTGSWDPNELATLNFVQFFARLRIRRYEQSVRDIYLEIARSVTEGE